MRAYVVLVLFKLVILSPICRQERTEMEGTSIVNLHWYVIHGKYTVKTI